MVVVDVETGNVLRSLDKDDFVDLFCVIGVPYRVVRERSDCVQLASNCESGGQMIEKRSFGLVAAAQTNELLILSWAGGIMCAHDLASLAIAWEQLPQNECCFLRFGFSNRQGFLPALISVPGDGIFHSLLDSRDGSSTNIRRLSSPVAYFHPKENVLVCGDGLIIDAFSGEKIMCWSRYGSGDKS